MSFPMMSPGITEALRRLQGGQGTDADKQLLSTFLSANQATLSPEELVTIQTALRQPTAPTSGLDRGGTGTDWQVEAQNQGLGTPPISGGVTIPSPGDIWAMGDPASTSQPSGGIGLGMPDLGGLLAMGDPGGSMIPGQQPPSGGLAGRSPSYFSPSSGGMTPPGAAPTSGLQGRGTPLAHARGFVPGTTAPPGQAENWKQWDPTNIGATPAAPAVGIPGAGNPMQERLMQREQLREERGRTGEGNGGGAGGENWKAMMKEFSKDPSSPFYGMSFPGAEIYADPNNVGMLSDLLYSQNEGMGSMMAPYVQGAMGMAGLGLLSGKRRDGLGTGPGDPGDTLALAEGFLDQLGPGELIDPSATYREAWKRVQHTDPSQFAPSGSTDADWPSQISNTKQALLISAAPFMTQDSGDALAQRIDIAAETWLHEISTGQTNQTFPQYLKSIGAARWVQG